MAFGERLRRLRRDFDLTQAVAFHREASAEATRRADCAEAFRSAYIAWPDGVPITWAARWIGRPIGPRVHGHDLMRLLFRRPVSHYFYGSTPEVIAALELDCMLEVAETVAHSALQRRESRGSHTRTDFSKRDDERFLKHTLAYRAADPGRSVSF